MTACLLLATLQTTKVNERTLCHIWNSQRFRRDDLRDADGAPLSIVYRGRWQHGPGPDFRGALVARAGGQLLHGDIEIHLRNADWYGHRHHLDPAFDSVVLHVVLGREGAAPARRHDGEVAPTLALEPYLAALPLPAGDAWAGEEWQDEPCLRAVAERGAAWANAILDLAGDERLAEHAAAFEGDLAALPAGEVLYRGLMDAMGYSGNRAPFRTLAARLPLAELVLAARALPADARAEGLGALLLASAGMAEPGVRARWGSLLEGVEPPACAGWRVAGIRPANHPRRRLRGMGALLARCGQSLAHDLCLEWPPGTPGAACRALRGRLVVATPRGEGGPRHLIGPGRAADAVVNVVLPFAVAYADLYDLPALAANARAAYAAHPRLAENEITRAIGGLLLAGPSRRTAGGARRQQGLLHVFKKYCDYRRCEECPLAHA